MIFIRKLLRLFGKSAAGATESERRGPEPLEQSHETQRYFRLPGTRQYGAGPSGRVDKTKWKPCHQCGRSIPVVADFIFNKGECIETGTWTYVCPFCFHGHVRTPPSHPDSERQETCHECSTKLGERHQCPHCAFPRGWMRVDCPLCGNRQPVFAPHWVVDCNTFHLECVQCECVFDSPCIC